MKTVKYSSKYRNAADKFECGNMVINNFLKSENALDANQGVTYVLLTDDENAIVGYYNISAGRIDCAEQVGERVIYKPMGGAVNINYLAVSRSFQRTRLVENESGNIYFGDILLRDCERRILSLREQLGAAFIVLCSTEQGYNLYQRNDYEDFDSDMNIAVDENNKSCHKMYKCIDDIVE